MCSPAIIAGDTYQHNVWVYDNDESAKKDPGNESDRTRKFMQEHGYEWEPQLVMSRFARIVDPSRKNEIILFYFDNLKDHTSKRASEFADETNSVEEKQILEVVDASSRVAFAILH